MITYKWLDDNIAVIQVDDKTPTYPTYPRFNVGMRNAPNNSYNIDVAVAGIDPQDLTVRMDNKKLLVMYAPSHPLPDFVDSSSNLIRGISNRAFILSFYVSDCIEVESVKLANGILAIKLIALEEEQTSRVFSIDVGDTPINVVRQHIDEIMSEAVKSALINVPVVTECPNFT